MNYQPITLELVLEESNAPLVTTGERDLLVSTLKPIVGNIERYRLFASKVVVNNSNEAELAAAMLEEIAADKKTVETSIKAHKDEAKKRHSLWCSLEGIFLDPFSTAHKLIKGKVLIWQESERIKAESERARLQAELDEKSRVERERAEKVALKLRTPELREQRLEEAMRIVAPVVNVSVPPKAVKSQRRWTVSKVDKAMFIAAAIANPQLRGFIEINEAALARAKASNSLFEADGITFESRLV